jgi:hypothetical protein
MSPLARRQDCLDCRLCAQSPISCGILAQSQLTRTISIAAFLAPAVGHAGFDSLKPLTLPTLYLPFSSLVLAPVVGLGSAH